MKKKVDAVKAKEVKETAYKAEKVTFRESLKIFDGVKMPAGLMIAAVVFSVISAVISLQTISFSGTAVDASGNIPVGEMARYIIFSLIAVAFNIASSVSTQVVGQKINYGIRNKLWDKIMALKAKTYDQDNGETLVTRITKDCEAAAVYFSTSVIILTQVISGVMYVVTLYQLNVRMANYLLLYIPISVIFGGIFAMLSFWTTQKMQGKIADVSAYVIERLRDMPQIKTSATEDVEEVNAGGYFSAYYRANLENKVAGGLGSVISTMLSMIAIIIPFALGAKMVAEGKITIGDVIIFNTMFGNVKGFFVNLITNIGTYKSANGALARVTRVLEEEDENTTEGEMIGEDAEEDICIKNLDFSYVEGRKILNNLECVIPKNKVTAILGTNGSGKSTVFKMIARLYEPEEGSISFGTENARKYSLESWRKKICLIQQDSPMMSGTIRENILYGCEEEISEEKLLEIAKASHVYDFVKDLPDGFDTYVEPGATNFSGGQKQCIAIARAMATNSEYLLLDEATSALDARREKDVLAALDAAMKDRTTVIIAHSLSSIRKADQVLVMKDGHIEESGTREDFLNRTDSYLNKLMARGTV